MKTSKTELVFILDRSGSMSGLENDTIGGFNSMLSKQKNEPNECRLTTVLFDNVCEVLHDRIEINAANPLTGRDYFVRGSTALLDAIGISINKIKAVQKNTAKDQRADKVLFVITTDGMENASKEFNYAKIKKMVESAKSKRGWEFIFLGANIDSVEVAGRFGVAKNRAQNFRNDGKGLALNYDVISETVSCYRAAPLNSKIDDEWGKKIQTDYVNRKNGA